jgi:hypothetical protein
MRFANANKFHRKSGGSEADLSRRAVGRAVEGSAVRPSPTQTSQE